MVDAKPKLLALAIVGIVSFVLLTILFASPAGNSIDFLQSSFLSAGSNNEGMSSSQAVSKPNILLIIADDVGFNDFGVNSDLYSMTPTLNSLLESGVELTNIYALPLCTPSRAALLTGKHPVQLGLAHWQIMPASSYGLSTSERIMPTYLKDQGYSTSLIGKWHLGHYKTASLPQNRGFDTFIGYVSGGIDYLSHVCSDACIDETTCVSDFNYNDQPITDRQFEYSSAVLTEYAVDLIAEHDATTPFFMTLALPNIHLPLEGSPTIEESEKFLELAKDVVNSDRRIIANMMLSLDQSVETVLQALRDQDLYKNTMIVFISDNGGLPDGGGSNFPLRAGKKYLFEGGVKVKSFIHSPLLSDTVVGSSYDGLMHVTDVLPTILQGMLGLTIADIDDGKFSADWYGVNQWNAIVDSAVQPPRSELLLNIDYLDKDHEVAASPKQAIIMDDYKLILNENNQGWYAVPNEVEETVVVETGPLGNFLFDLSQDPYEQKNLYDSPSHADKVAAMTKRLANFRPMVAKSKYLADDATCWGAWLDTLTMAPWTDGETDEEVRARLLPSTSSRIAFEAALPKKSLSECPQLLGFDV